MPTNEKKHQLLGQAGKHRALSWCSSLNVHKISKMMVVNSSVKEEFHMRKVTLSRNVRMTNRRSYPHANFATFTSTIIICIEYFLFELLQVMCNSLICLSR